MSKVLLLVLAVLLAGLAKPASCQLAALAPTAGFDRYKDLNMAGSDFAGSPHKGYSESGCVRLCSRTPACVGVVYIVDASVQSWCGNCCWLKNQITTTGNTIAAAKGIVTYIRNPWEIVSDMYTAGGDMAGSPIKGLTSDQCSALCYVTPGCLAAVYSTINMAPIYCDKCCWLKNSIGNEVASFGYTTYFKRQFQVFKNTDIMGGDMPGSPFKGLTERQCASKCASTPGCAGLVYIAQASAQPTCPNCCWLKNKLTTDSATTGMVTYVRRQYERYDNTDVYGADFASNPNKAPDEQACLELCAKTSGCVGAVYLTTTTAMPSCPNCCWLKNKINKESTYNGLTTYTKNY